MDKNEVIEAMSKLGYKYTDDGNILNSKNAEIANFLIVPKRQVRVKQHDSYEISVELSAIIMGDKEVKNIKLPASEVASLKWVDSQLGLDAIVYERREFIIFIKKLFANVEVTSQYSHTGWIKSQCGTYEYLDYCGAIQNQEIQVEMDEHFKSYKFPRKKIDIKLAAQQSLNLLNVVDKGIGYILLGLVFLCPLLEFIGEGLKLPEFVVWLYGLTGTRKTTIAKSFAAHFGNFENRVTASFNDTYTSIELKAHKLKDSLMLLDDFCPQQSYRETQNINTIAEKIVRAYGDRTSRGRSTVTMESQIQFIPRGMAIITGESIVPGSSTVARLVPIEMKKDSVNLKELTKTQKNLELLSINMREFILWIKNEANTDYDELVDAIKVNYNNYLDEIKEKAVDTHGRTYEAFAWLLLGLDMMYQFYCHIGIITQNQADKAIDDAKKEFLEQIKIKDENSRTEDPVELFLETIKELLTSNALTMKNVDTDEVIGNSYKPIDVFFDSEYYYFNSNNIYGIVRSKLQRAGIYFQLPPRALLKALGDREIIKTEEKNNLPKKIIRDANGNVSRPRMLHIKRHFID
ncbi:hypothetical protein [Clostridium saccharoperbutylacetonicum]|uniref:hypothetical protein n=1 Tax=Clostridium saccharoperbutylacetonicum TaxID=36745 RepID=UPI000984025F|nr:hypothetical protein [Clostridium saccharoperbutylacetonicum]AQR98206.1 hypothetical protein CLSAP_55610 [Clostridium saccharoperbutylacetonicum]NSB34101.1 hypothetical protein [Clostridium saccharoperbutylacetonicum]